MLYLIFHEQEQYQEWQTRLNNIQAALELLKSEANAQLMKGNLDLFIKAYLKQGIVESLY